MDYTIKSNWLHFDIKWKVNQSQYVSFSNFKVIVNTTQGKQKTPPQNISIAIDPIIHKNGK